MAEYYNPDDRIECISAEIIAKKFVPSVPKKHPKIGLSLSYKCTRDSSAEICKECNPKKAIIHKNSKLDLGDKLACKDLYFITQGIKRHVIQKLGGHSHRHKSQMVKTSAFTYAEITHPFDHIQKAIEKKSHILNEGKPFSSNNKDITD